MKKRVRFIWLLAGITITGIILFQVYWVYNSYKTEERNFYSSVNFSLQRSINTYLLKRIGQGKALNLNLPPSGMTGGRVEMAMADNKLPGINGTQGIVIGPFNREELPPDSSQVLKLAMASIMARNSNESLKLAELSLILKDELGKNNLPISFRLSLLRKQKTLPADLAAAFVGFSKDNDDVVVADVTNAGKYLLLRTLVPALISLLLIFFSAASLFYMGIIIRRQMRLDAMKDDFFSNITHELRTPISILKSTHEALHKFGQSSDAEITSRYLQINARILDKLDNNVDRILDIIRYKNGVKPVNIKQVDLLILLEEAIAEFTPYAQATIRYNLPHTCLVDTDRYIVSTVLSNLVDNAIKYAGSRVNIKITASIGDNHWKLEVKDNGRGIDQQYLPFIFDKFYRVPSGNIHDVKGYGLGLSYVKELVSALNGHINVRSTVGIGTAFIVQFPLYV